MKNKLFHKHIDIKDNSYFLDYVQLYFKLPIEDLKVLDGFNLEDCRIWLKFTSENISNMISRSNIQGVRVIQDKLHYGIKFYFEGQFFNGANIKQDIARLKKYTQKYYNEILHHQYNPNSWEINNKQFLNHFCGMEFPKFYVSRFDLAQNCYKKFYIDGLKNNNWDTYCNSSIEKSKNCVDTIFNDRRSQTQTGYTVGNPKYVTCKVYDKMYDKEEFSLDHALNRFGTYKFWRREWRIQKKKIKSLKINHLEEFLLLKNTQVQKYVIASIRKSVDIVMKNDSVSYTIFHFTHIDNDVWQSLKDDTINLTKRVKLLISGRHAKQKAIGDRKIAFWDGVANLVGIANNYRHRWSQSQWIKAVESLIKEPERLEALNNPDSHVDINKVKEFLAHIKYR